MPSAYGVVQKAPMMSIVGAEQPVNERQVLIMPSDHRKVGSVRESRMSGPASSPPGPDSLKPAQAKL